MQDAERRVGWLEVAAGLVAYLLLVGLIGGNIQRVPDEQAAWRGVFRMAGNTVSRWLLPCALANRYRPWVSIVGSAAIFAFAHGPSVILLDAFMVGIIAGILFKRAGSIWPPFVLHAVYSGPHPVYYAYQ